MSKGLRWTLTAGALLVAAVVIAVYVRLDAVNISRQSLAQYRLLTGHDIQVRKVSFSLAHGLSLRLRDVEIRSGRFRIVSADEIYVELKLLPLLQGRSEVQAVYAVAPQVFSSHWPASGFNLKPGFVLKRLHISQGSLIVGSRALATDILIDARNIGAGRRMRWEMQGRLEEGDVHVHGKAMLKQDGMAKIFGKLKVKQVSVHTLLEKPLTQNIAYEHLDAALTFDLTEDGDWQLFGELLLLSSSKGRPPLTFRGKLQGRLGQKRFEWREGFVHIGKTSRLVTNGSCTWPQECKATLRGKGMVLADLLAAAGSDFRASGILGVDAALLWRHGVWTVNAEGDLKKLAWSDISQPELSFKIRQWRHDRQGHMYLASAKLMQAGKKGFIEIDSLAVKSSAWDASIIFRDVEDWWVQAGNILLALNRLAPALEGRGILRGNLNMRNQGQRTQIRFHWDAGQTRVNYAGLFSKPVDVAGIAKGQLDLKNGGWRLLLDKLELASSSLVSLRLHTGRENQSLSIGRMSIDFTRLQALRVQLPFGMNALKGKLVGYLATASADRRTDLKSWLLDMYAELTMRGWGKEHHALNGHVSIRRGMIRTKKVRWQSRTDRATLGGHIDLPKQRGSVNISNASVHWQPGVGLPDWLADVKLKGTLEVSRLQYTNHIWRKVRAGYSYADDTINLRGLQMEWAGGMLQANHLNLQIRPEATRFSGPVVITGMDLSRLKGMKQALAGILRGRLFLNARLEGGLPVENWSEWNGNGDIAIYGGSWSGVNMLRELSHLSGWRKPIRDEDMTRFRHFGMRFRFHGRGMRIPRLQLEAKNWQASGQGNIHENGEIEVDLDASIKPAPSEEKRGRLQIRIAGKWPGIRIEARR